MKQLAVVVLLLAIVYIRTDFFSVGAISAPLLEEEFAPLNSEIEQALSQKYCYLGKGKQAYAFQSEDGKWVIKFFQQSYYNTPFWAHLFPREIARREKRMRFYQNSYQIASKMLKKDTGIVYLHQGPSLEPLPHLTLTDKGGRTHCIDLQKVPFVLQKKADPFYASISSLPKGELDRAIEQFLSLIAYRIDHKIRDGDHKIVDNFGILEGNVVQIDAGKLYFDKSPWDAASLKEEWWSTTHRFKKWLEANAPDRVAAFETAIKTNLEKYQ